MNDGSTEELVAQLSYHDPLVAYSALRALEVHESKRVIRLLLSPERLQAKSAFSYQLLRRLLARAHAQCDSQSGSEEDEIEDLSNGVVRAALVNADALSEAVLALLRASPVAASESESSAAFELLSFVSETVAQLAGAGFNSLAAAERSGALRLAATLMDAFAGEDVSFAAHPTYVSSAAVACLHSLLRLLVANGEALLSMRERLRRLLRLVVGERSSLTRRALALLRRPRAECDDDAFVSTTSRFPFLQTWLAFASSAALTLVENRASLEDEDLMSLRATADDVMVEVLNTLLQLSVAVEALDPDLLFADVLETFGHDHLVLLDLLISSETAMLEYLLRYLRRLSANWDASRAVLGRPRRGSSADRFDGGHSDDSSDDSSDDGTSASATNHRRNEQLGCCLDDVVGVLIRLRFEIDKQVAAAMFPYNPRALRRRLVHVEALYESA
ncbi:hypothetical protein PybrP1_011165 [[Pythium] brassicae (nom. inval.)]|nr:hypothetical protein PybrP1_011165 [[Pythium] brassicae (nom. inval.)]